MNEQLVGPVPSLYACLSGPNSCLGKKDCPFQWTTFFFAASWKMWNSLSWSLPLHLNLQRNSYITSISRFLISLLSFYVPFLYISWENTWNRVLFQHLINFLIFPLSESDLRTWTPNGSYTFLQGEVTKLWRRCFFPCVPSWKIEPLGPFWGITPKTEDVSCAMWVVKLGWEFGMFWRIWWGGGFNRVQWERFELQQETWRLSWASFFCQAKGCAFSGIHLFQGKTHSYFLLVLNLDNGQAMNIVTCGLPSCCFFNGSIYQECR